MLPKKTHEEIHRIWNELTAFSAADGDSALEFLLRTTARMIDAHDATWAGAVRMLSGTPAAIDPQHGWRSRAVRLLDGSAKRRKLSTRAINEQGRPNGFMTASPLMKQGGRFHGARLRQLVDFERFRRTRHYRWYYRALGIEDRMWIAFPVNAGAESLFVFDRRQPGARFTKRELDIAVAVLRGLRWFHRQTLLRHGLLVANHPLSPTQQRVLALLLTDASEKQIAARLGQSFHTTHTHVREIFRRFGVAGRAGLMAIWLGGR